MNQSATLVPLVALTVIVGAVALAVALSRRTKLRSLPAESRERYARSWRRVEDRFIDDPAAAVQEADRIAVMILSERGATLSDPRTVPGELHKARGAAAGEGGRQGTEGMRISLMHYRNIVDDGVGASRMTREHRRREFAS